MIFYQIKEIGDYSLENHTLKPKSRYTHLHWEETKLTSQSSHLSHPNPKSYKRNIPEEFQKDLTAQFH